ncbi:MAG: hypothetical protein HDT22_00820 [Ruminococcus sp.]|nr:hypothetical protein [Ruminococcus sp.]
MHENSFTLKKIDNKNRFYFKKQLPKRNINYFVLIPEFAYESKLWFDRSKKLIIETEHIEKYLLENHVTYERFYCEKFSGYIYRLIDIDDNILYHLKNCRYQMTEKFAKQEIPRYSCWSIFCVFVIIIAQKQNEIASFVYFIIIGLVFIFLTWSNIKNFRKMKLDYRKTISEKGEFYAIYKK